MPPGNSSSGYPSCVSIVAILIGKVPVFYLPFCRASSKATSSLLINDGRYVVFHV